MFYGQRASNIVDEINVVVYTAAVHPDNPEYAAVVKKGIPMLSRAELLGQMMKNYQYYKIEDEDLKKRLMNPYVQTNRLVDEAISLEQVVTQGYINLKEKAGNRKDRVMSLAYGLWYAKLLEDQYINKQETNSLLDWTFFG